MTILEISRRRALNWFWIELQFMPSNWIGIELNKKSLNCQCLFNENRKSAAETAGPNSCLLSKCYEDIDKQKLSKNLPKKQLGSMHSGIGSPVYLSSCSRNLQSVQFCTQLCSSIGCEKHFLICVKEKLQLWPFQRIRGNNSWEFLHAIIASKLRNA